ncbi:unnamed protein product [Fusarium graminearum]|uniref:DUF1330 domain-containing protein n=1 Tax=Gibberella zeae TaxID=5518 RepID=A0A4E9EGE2_GIBZA|nr:unnamed protein product [Fusarium graminearum]
MTQNPSDNVTVLKPNPVGSERVVRLHQLILRKKLVHLNRNTSETMVAYVVCQMSIHDPSTYRKYTALTPAVVKRHGGRFLTRGDPVSTLEGDTFKNRMVILEFPDEEAVNRWYEDPDYAAAMKFRHEASVGSMLVQEGQQNTENPEPNV